MREPLEHIRDPLAKSILHGRELGQLSSVVGIHAESFGVTKLRRGQLLNGNAPPG